jgi:hypothetical protein
MRKFTNGTSVPLSMAVFLATDNYDHEDHTISATVLLKPLRQLILASRVPQEQQLVDITSLVKSRMGSAIHDAIERSWVENHQQGMLALGYPERVATRVRVNPEPHEVTEDVIPVYLEQRSYREIMGYTVSGKFDFVGEGRVEDFKSTSVNTWINDNKTDDYRLQGSIYRWLNPEIITQDHMAIQFLFTDWFPGRAKADPKYPQRPVEQKLIPLLPIEETEAFIRNKLTQIQKYQNSPEELLPLCNDKELWRTEPQFKYYKNPEKTSRSTKNFDNKQDAYLRLAQDGNVGIVVEVPGQVIACKYCPAFPVCSQKDALVAEGSLIL